MQAIILKENTVWLTQAFSLVYIEKEKHVIFTATIMQTDTKPVELQHTVAFKNSVLRDKQYKPMEGF